MTDPNTPAFNEGANAFGNGPTPGGNPPVNPYAQSDQPDYRQFEWQRGYEAAQEEANGDYDRDDW
jgi:hypothetical protein